MSTPHEDKISRHKIEVVIFTPQYRIEGEIHVPPGGRITDLVNIPQTNFIAVTSARIYRAIQKREEPLYKKDFLALNKEYIIIISPRDEEGCYGQD